MENAVLHLENANIYQGDSLVLSNINLTINKGDFFYMIGKTGSGKSSLMKTLYADIPLQSGTGTVVGFDLENLKDRKVYRKYGFNLRSLKNKTNFIK